MLYPEEKRIYASLSEHTQGDESMTFNWRAWPKLLPLLVGLAFVAATAATLSYGLALKHFAQQASVRAAKLAAESALPASALEVRTAQIVWKSASLSYGVKFRIEGSDEVILIPIELIGGEARWQSVEPFIKPGVRVRLTQVAADRTVRELIGSPDTPFQRPLVTPAHAEAGQAEIPRNAARGMWIFGSLACALALVIALWIGAGRRRRRRGTAAATLLTLALVGAGGVGTAHASDEAKFRLQDVTIPGATASRADLVLDTKNAKIEPAFRDFQTDAQATVPGKVRGERATVLFAGREVPVAPDGSFKVVFRLTSPRSQFALTAVDVRGEVRERTYLLSFPDYATWLAKQTNPHKRRFNFSAGLGYTHLNYFETGLGNFTEGAITVKGSALYVWKARLLDLGMSAYFTAMPLSASLAGAKTRFLGLNGRIGYVLPFANEPWRISIMTGIYYTSMFTSTASEAATFGFHDLMGPQLYPVVRYSLKRGDVLAGYFKFSPVGGGFNLQNLDNREIAFGLSWTAPKLIQGGVTFSVDVAELALLIDGVTISSRTFSFSIGRSW